MESIMKLKSKEKKLNNACANGVSVSQEEIFKYYNEINKDTSHMISNDDICTPMECVKTMLDYIPEDFWKNQNIKVLDPCAGNGNFYAYCMFKTNPENIWNNDINEVRLQNFKKILNPTHVTKKDFLQMDVETEKWDLIMGNPPYSGGGNKNRSLSNAFIEKAIELLNDGGFLCFVTPNNWMTYNTKNSTLKKLLSEGSFVVIDNDAKKFFAKVGSSFTIIVWQKNVKGNRTLVKNNFLLKDIQKDVVIPQELPFIPLYISQTVIGLIPKITGEENGRFFYRCDLHNFTQKAYLSDQKDDVYKYETIHTMRKTRYASKKQDIFDKWNIIVPLSTYFEPKVMHNVNTTQSVGYISFNTQNEAEKYLETITQPQFKLMIHLTRYGNFNNIMVLKHLKFDAEFSFNENENREINNLVSKIKY